MNAFQNPAVTESGSEAKTAACFLASMMKRQPNVVWPVFF